MEVASCRSLRPLLSNSSLLADNDDDHAEHYNVIINSHNQ